MTRGQAMAGLALVLLAVVFARLVSNYAELEHLRPLAAYYVQQAPADLGAANVVTAILITYRGFAAVLAGQSCNRLTDLDDLSGRRPDLGDDPRRIDLELGEADRVMRRLELRLGGIHLGFGGAQGARRLVVIGPRRPAVAQQPVLAVEVVAPRSVGPARPTAPHWPSARR